MQNLAVSSAAITDLTSPTTYLSHITMLYRNYSITQKQINYVEGIYVDQTGIPSANVKTYRLSLYKRAPDGSLIRVTSDESENANESLPNLAMPLAADAYAATPVDIYSKQLEIQMALRPTISTPYETLYGILNSTSSAISRDIKRYLAANEVYASKVVEITVPANCFNGKADAGETDVDCGGPCGGCTKGKECDSNADCLSANCNSSYFCEEPLEYDETSNAKTIFANYIVLFVSVLVGILTTIAMRMFRDEE